MTEPSTFEVSFTLRYRVPETDAGYRFFQHVPDILGQSAYLAGADWYGGKITLEPFHIFELEAKALAAAESLLECQLEFDGDLFGGECGEKLEAFDEAVLALRDARRALARAAGVPR